MQTTAAQWPKKSCELKCLLQVLNLNKVPEELTLLLIKLRRRQAEISSLQEHTVAQLMALGIEGPNAKVSPKCACMHM
ncbi:hypothetical protein GOODEAATRI_028599 [Goodea atripinnis]|uniref:Uncharacterized protein n=1 Tax=Goodea atripinnis TaxID=208336 RepID=A0ABV0P8J3_9TELE